MRAPIRRYDWTAQDPSGDILEHSKIKRFDEKRFELVHREHVEVTLLEESDKTVLSEKYEVVWEVQRLWELQTFNICSVTGNEKQ
jgi:hypothetical protein